MNPIACNYSIVDQAQLARTLMRCLLAWEATSAERDLSHITATIEGAQSPSETRRPRVVKNIELLQQAKPSGIVRLDETFSASEEVARGGETNPLYMALHNLRTATAAWDPTEGVLPSEETIVTAEKFLALLPTEMSLPKIGLGGEGDLFFILGKQEWERLRHNRRERSASVTQA